MVAANEIEEPTEPQKPARILPAGLLTREQLAAELGVDIRTVDHWIHAGIYNGVKLRVEHAGRQIRIRRADYAAFQAEVDKRRGKAERERRKARQQGAS